MASGGEEELAPGVSRAEEGAKARVSGVTGGPVCSLEHAGEAG